MRTLFRGFLLLGLLLIGLLPVGCGSSPVMPVTGVVTRNGNPVPNLFLNFIPDEGRPSWGKSDDNGRFVLHYDEKQEGAMVGLHTVTVSVRAGSPAEEMAMQSGRLRQSPEIKAILDRYGYGKPKPLRIEIRRDQPEIELKLD